jgi:hypothetical protein
VREIAIALGLFVVLVVSSLVLRAASWSLLLYGGGFLVVGGMVFSIPCALRYHWLLYTSLKPRGDLDKRWIWNPTSHHPRLLPDERHRVLPWFYAGAAGWGASVAGCALLALAAFAGR